jgi:hypothetical protein
MRLSWQKKSYGQTRQNQREQPAQQRSRQSGRYFRPEEGPGGNSHGQ